MLVADLVLITNMGTSLFMLINQIMCLCFQTELLGELRIWGAVLFTGSSTQRNLVQFIV